LREAPKFQNLFVMGESKRLIVKENLKLGQTLTTNLPKERSIAGTHALVKRY
jgi:hypothetical protein